MNDTTRSNSGNSWLFVPALIGAFFFGRWTADAKSPEPTPSAVQPFAAVAPAPSDQRPYQRVETTPVIEPVYQADDDQADDVYYANCTEARAAGAAPILRGEPGYAPKLDRDDDGVACE